MAPGCTPQVSAHPSLFSFSISTSELSTLLRTMDSELSSGSTSLIFNRHTNACSQANEFDVCLYDTSNISTEDPLAIASPKSGPVDFVSSGPDEHTTDSSLSYSKPLRPHSLIEFASSPSKHTTCDKRALFLKSVSSTYSKEQVNLWSNYLV
ncbi:unnamed protein product [Protopolystoma xenopodis]|uniref:Uncharacterized protein n=1 Tax=Protopolystoma xenopodis TaxID=117903 RepID=A0A448WM85_9PLAT|nr:unnamed protein product [Protopolystoma xenopodis]